MSEVKTVLGSHRPPASLVGEKGELAGRTAALAKAQVVIGRDPTAADVVLADAMVSRLHARITWLASEYIIEDLGSSNGTSVNGQRLTAFRALGSGDRITIGQNVFAFHIADPAAEPAPAPDQTVILRSPVVAAPSVADGPVPSEGPVPARAVLEAAQATNRDLGHENLGALSETHGFLPITPPPLALPPSHKAWDDIAARLPELWRAIRVRQELHALPVLGASEAELPDEYLQRASAIISILAHAYHRISAEPPDAPMPAGVQAPWEQISQRLNRPAPHLSYNDLILYNWRLRDTARRDDPFALDNLDLLVSTVDNQEEKVLYLMQVEAHHKIGPLVGAVVRAQEAVARADIDALKRELILISDGLQRFGSKVFMALDPNPYSDTFVDPVIWAKTVAPFAVPVTEGVVGPSGVSAPLFHMLDVFFARHHYNTHLGEEMLNMRNWYPRHWREFFEALGQISVADFVARAGDPVLAGLYKDATQSYAGDSGFLSIHKLKAYGYLDIAFKVGRSVTIGGFSGLFKDRVWDAAVDELAASEDERAADFPDPGHFAPVTRIETLNPEGDPARWVKRVRLDLSGTGARYRPGDRCAILPENSDELVEKTLTALRANGAEQVTLTAAWRDAIRQRFAHRDGAETVDLRSLLRFGRIRPVDRAVAKALLAVSFNGKLRRIVESRAEDQWELWDLLTMLGRAGFDTRRLWKAHPGERAHICRIVVPEKHRMYSISSTSEHASPEGAQDLTLTVGRLLYDTPDTALTNGGERQGTGSHFLAQGGDGAASGARPPVGLKLVRPARFDLPEDPAIPIVMFAGGTGIAPFRGFVQDRAGQPGAGESWLFLGARDRHEFPYADELAPLVAQGRLQVRVASSRDDAQVRFAPDGSGGSGGFVLEPGERKYIGEEMLREENARLLWDMIRPRQAGGQGGHIYVCGRTGFAQSVMAAIKDIARRFADGDEERKDAQARELLYRLVGEGRYKQDIFTTYTGSHLAQGKTRLDASEIVLHNNARDGFWMVISGRVYDLSEFGHLHPGGFKIIHAYAGMDGTQAYEKVRHHINPEVDSMLGMYELGLVRRLDFGMEWGVVVAPDGLRFMALGEGFRAWVRFLYNVVEMENALSNDYLLKAQTIIADDPPDAFPPIKLQYLYEVHDRFMANFVAGTTGGILENLWAVTSGFCSRGEDVRWMKREIARINDSQEAATVRQLGVDLQKRIDDIVAREAPETDPAVRLVRDLCALLETEDKRFLHEMKMASRLGVQVFETHERDAVRAGGGQLLAAVGRFPRALEGYYARVLSGALRILLDHPG